MLSWGLVVSSSGASSPGLIVRGASCSVTDRSHRLSNGRDRRANVRAMAAFTGMLLNFNISNLFKLWRFFILDVV